MFYIAQRTAIWTFNKTSRMNFWTPLQLYVPNAASNLAYRLSLFAQSDKADTYLAVRSLQYSTNLFRCGHGQKTVPPTTTTLPTVSPTKSLFCDFEQNTLCNWKSPSGSFRVGTPEGSNIPHMYLPPYDHTRSSRLGHIVFTYGNQQFYATRGTLQADNPFPSQQICFEFYYYFYASGSSNFVLTMDGQATPVPVFRAYAANEIKWKRAIFTIIPNTSYKTFTFSSSVKEGVLAIDDINVRLGACPVSDTERHCDFEMGSSCIFGPVFNAAGIWKVFQAYSFGIPDHTTRSRDGHYYGMEFRGVPKSTATQRFLIQSKQIDGTRFHCLRFSYLIVNALPSTSLFYEIERTGPVFGGSISRPLRWKTAGNTVGMWFSHRVPIPRYTSMDIRMGIEINGESEGKVFVDDIFLDSTFCPYPHNCDFEVTSGLNVIEC